MKTVFDTIVNGKPMDALLMILCVALWANWIIGLFRNDKN